MSMQQAEIPATNGGAQSDSEREIDTTVKWFDPIKGFGFLIPEEGSDILVHHSTLKESGHNTLYPGAVVRCTVVEREKGFQAGQIVSVDNSDAHIPHQHEPRPHPAIAEITDIGEFERVIVKWFNRVRGFGFVNTEKDNLDIFIHMETLRNAQINSLEPGDCILARYGKGPKGLMAAEVKPNTEDISNGVAIADTQETPPDADAPAMVATG